MKMPRSSRRLLKRYGSLASRRDRTLGAVIAALNAVNDIAGDLNIVILRTSQMCYVLMKEAKTYSELANLGVINTHDLILLRSTQTHTRNEVEDEQDETCPEERVSKTGDRVG